MNIEEFRAYCLSKKGVIESFPFDQSTLVFKVMDKMFALTGLENIERTANLKCDPYYAEELRASYGSVKPGFHMNKKHWNTIHLESSELHKNLVKELIDHSYDLVVAKLPKKRKKDLTSLK